MGRKKSKTGKQKQAQVIVAAKKKQKSKAKKCLKKLPSKFGGLVLTKAEHGKSSRSKKASMGNDAFLSTAHRKKKKTTKHKKHEKEDENMMDICNEFSATKLRNPNLSNLKSIDTSKTTKNENKQFNQEFESLRERKLNEEKQNKIMKNQRNRNIIGDSPLLPATLTLTTQQTTEELLEQASNKVQMSLVVNPEKIYPMSILPKVKTLPQVEWKMKPGANDKFENNPYTALGQGDSDDEDKKSGAAKSIFNFSPPSFEVSSFIPIHSTREQTCIDPDL